MGSVSSKAEMIGKSKLGEVLRFNDEERKSTLQVKATWHFLQVTVCQKLNELELTKLYEDVEMPLIYSLAKMENTE